MPEIQADPLSKPDAEHLSQRLRRRLAALGVVGAMMVALPLVQVLRYQNAAEASLEAARAALDPTARSVDVERSLIAHRDLAAKVLRGQKELEPERRTRQAQVDARLRVLGTALVFGAWDRAISEADALREDWTLLASEVQSRSISPIESDQAHRLLLEQTLQVIDLVGSNHSAQASADSDLAQPTEAVARAVPRLAMQISGLAAGAASGAPDPLTQRRDLAAAEAALARTLGRLDAALGPNATPHRELADLGATAGATADHFFELLRTKPALPEATHEAASTALAAQFKLFDAAQATLGGSLADHIGKLHRQREGLVLALGLLAAGAAFLAAGLARQLQPLPAAAREGDDAPSERRAAPSGRELASELMLRLRAGETPGRTPEAEPGREHADESKPTLPPPL